jgi:hypothetical protein
MCDEVETPTVLGTVRGPIALSMSKESSAGSIPKVQEGYRKCKEEEEGKNKKDRKRIILWGKEGEKR